MRLFHRHKWKLFSYSHSKDYDNDFYNPKTGNAWGQPVTRFVFLCGQCTKLKYEQVDGWQQSVEQCNDLQDAGSKPPKGDSKAQE